MQLRTVPGLLLIGFVLTSTNSFAEPDWSMIPGRTISMFYPGPAGLEWVLNNADHTGSRKVRDQKQTCMYCHDEDAEEIGNYLIAGKKVGKRNVILEPQDTQGRRGSYPLSVKAAHDDKKLYLHFEWESAPPAQVVAGESSAASNTATPQPEQKTNPVLANKPANKLDPKNEVKFTVMFDAGEVEFARQAGCWATCHLDLRTMPDADPKASKDRRAKAMGWKDGVTKYLGESRSEVAFDGQPRGGWNKLRDKGEIAAALKAGKFLDLMQFRSGARQKPVDGYVLESRHMGGGKSLVSATGRREGNKWSVSFERLLEAGGVGDHAIKPGQQFTFGFAIHENYGTARYHQVSLGYTLGLDDSTAYFNVEKLPVPGATKAAETLAIISSTEKPATAPPGN